jgi:hypothetical protein
MFSQLSVWRAFEVLIGLLGVAVVALAYRLVHQTCSEAFRAAILADAMLLLFGPLVVGYLLLDFLAVNMGWWWLISPPALAVRLALDGLTWPGVLVGLVGYSAVSVAAMPLVLGLTRRRRAREEQRAQRRQARL